MRLSCAYMSRNFCKFILSHWQIAKNVLFWIWIKFCIFQYSDKLSAQVDVIYRIQDNESKVDACKMKEYAGNWGNYWIGSYLLNSRTSMESMLQELEYKLSVRLIDETFRGVINFLRATIRDTPINEIEKALVIEKTNITKQKHFMFCSFFYRNIFMMIYPKQTAPKKARAWNISKTSF